ncbi:hypothetical protein SUGI_0112730 [Cryptomeria japonica]|nr:hypothetical protein SUGI_0112730 [Cryptomeria japonica]
MKIIPLAVHFLVFYLQLCLSAHTSNNGSFNDEHEALLAFKNSITSDPNKVLSSWDANTNVCNWTGISCNKLMRVTEIDLESMGLVELCQKLSNLQELRLQGNQLTESIPTSLGNCSNLKELHLKLFQSTSTEFVEESAYWDNANISSKLFQSASTESLGNQLSGPIPSLPNCFNLEVLSLAENQLSGPIPFLANCSNLQQLGLDQNQLSGPIPTSLGNCSRLEQLNLSENQFRRLLSLWGNQLNGPILTSLGNCSKLKILSLAFNNLTGTVPLQLGKLSSLQRLRLNYNFLTSSRNLPFLAALINCSTLQTLYLGHNYLAEDLSPSIGKLSTRLSILSLGYNLIGGSIPQEIGNLTNLTYIDFTSNALTGPIPSTLERLKILKRVMDLSYNNKLFGEIPKRGPLTNLTAPPFKGYPGPSGGFWHFHKLFKYMIYVIPALIMFGIYVLFLYTYLFQKGSVEQPSIEFQHPRISYKELSTATSRFGKGNLLGVGGVGSVYKGVLDNGTLIAVKALDLENEAAHKSFSIECQVLSKAKHRNIIKVITSCSNLDFKGLVFEFMPNGSLQKHLHYDAGKFNIGSVCKMNLQTRLQIAMDIACGLAYLHHDCSIQVVHCDLKPNNVLLDFYMTAHIADFGNAHILSENSMHSFSSSTTLKGALGYIAPEYGVGARISAKGDVYSYGILLLEMLTRKRPTHQMFVDGLSLRMWVSMAFPDRISEVVDDSLMLCNGGVTDSTCSCLIQLVRVALLCSKDSPKDRPSMAEVVEMLQCIEDMFEGSRIDSKYQSDLYQVVSSARWARNLVKVENGQSTFTLQSSS